MGHGPDHLPADHPQNGLQEAENVRDAPGNCADAAGLNGERDPFLFFIPSRPYIESIQFWMDMSDMHMVDARTV